MGNEFLSWWHCDYCRADIFYATRQAALEEVVASHFQRCMAIQKELAALYLRMAAEQKAIQQKKERK